jgi:hypothetical protein
MGEESPAGHPEDLGEQWEPPPWPDYAYLILEVAPEINVSL